MLAYEITPSHPLKPERLRRTIELLERFGVSPIDPGLACEADMLRVHTPEYLEAVRALDPAEFLREGVPLVPGTEALESLRDPAPEPVNADFEGGVPLVPGSRASERPPDQAPEP